MFFNLSLRFKLPLWGSLLIVITALTLSLTFMGQAYDDLKQDVLRSSEDLGLTMSRALIPLMLHDDMWLAFEMVSLPFQENSHTDGMHAESLIVLDPERRVYVSSLPERYPVLAELPTLGREFAYVDKSLGTLQEGESKVLEPPDSSRLFIVLPIIADGVTLGTLLVVHDTSSFWFRFLRLADRALWITLIVLGVLLPINWYWGQRMTRPLSLLAQHMETIHHQLPEALEPGIYEYGDELGRLYKAFAEMVAQLKEKALLEKQMIQSERMAAVGRFTASIAHEINNPLGGMFNAISTLKRHVSLDPVAQMTVSHLERGLQQIRDTVAALLVEAKLKSRFLIRQDFDDVRLLVTHEAHKKHVELAWSIATDESLPLASTLVRQILINLLLNAIQAASDGGHVSLRAAMDGDNLLIRVENDGKMLTPEQMGTLFEPFSRFSEQGNGLGLWIIYQIVQQLKGTVTAGTDAGITHFLVLLPLTEQKDGNV
ncbi:two-component sensor histidine kinase [Sulfurimicrobium lacus]|uniref:histidine kinase n=1 Tax=Sulfurimicrobium lacus TaxID=2715678 RepID=A0A6F8VC36_9PROT|nr:HAMP domain-containing sensor histidine kinase [Sulfurimicrobium lacus]BCB27403.1 two-component sensor histidine kinase [Sulfurimicrobium lacus]